MDYDASTVTATEQDMDICMAGSGSTQYMYDNVFSVKPNPLTFVSALGNFRWNPTRNSLSHVNLMEIAVHCWRKGVPLEQARKKVDYTKTPTIFGIHPPWTNTMRNIPRLSPDEVVYLERPDPFTALSGKKPMLRPEQKQIQLMMYLIEKFSEPGDFSMDPCAGTFPVAMACMLVKRHRRFIGGDVDPFFITYVKYSLIETYARHVLNRESNLEATEEKGGENLIAAAQLLVMEL